MRIAFVSEGLAGGGSERQTILLADSFSNDNVDDVFIITGGKKENEYGISERVKRLCTLKGNKNIISDAVTLLRISKKYRLNVIVGMGIYANLLVSFAKLLGIRARVVVSEMNDPKHDNLSYKSKLLRKLLYWKADGYVFQTAEEKAYYSKRIQKKSIIIHNPVKSGIPCRTDIRNKEIVAVGRLMPQKNYPLLLKVFANVCQNHPEYILRIFGNGTEEENLRRLCRHLQIEKNVVFEGFCLDVHQKIVNSDIYVLSSDYEGMPNALMEAMAMGFPVVATDCYGGGPRELIQNGVNGLLVPRENEKKMAHKIIRLIEDEALNARIAKKAMEIRETHSGEKIASQWKEYIYLLCKGRKTNIAQKKYNNSFYK